MKSLFVLGEKFVQFSETTVFRVLYCHLVDKRSSNILDIRYNTFLFNVYKWQLFSFFKLNLQRSHFQLRSQILASRFSRPWNQTKLYFRKKWFFWKIDPSSEKHFFPIEKKIRSRLLRKILTSEVRRSQVGMSLEQLALAFRASSSRLTFSPLSLTLAPPKSPLFCLQVSSSLPLSLLSPHFLALSHKDN